MRSVRAVQLVLALCGVAAGIVLVNRKPAVLPVAEASRSA
jgi:hypothetical protein